MNISVEEMTAETLVPHSSMLIVLAHDAGAYREPVSPYA